MKTLAPLSWLWASLSLPGITFAAPSDSPDPRFTVHHTAQSLKIYDAIQHTLLWHFEAQDQPFTFAQEQARVHELRGSFQRTAPTYQCLGEFPKPTSPQPYGLAAGESLKLQGSLHGPGCTGNYQLNFKATAPTFARLRMHLQAPTKIHQTRIRFHSTPGPYYGLGAQFDPLPLQGDYPMIVQEGGIGRGAQPLSLLMNTISPGSAGNHGTTYLPQSVLWSLQGSFFHLRGNALSNWHIANPGEIKGMDSGTTLTLEVEGAKVEIDGFTALSPLRGLSQLTTLTGRPPRLPDWIHRGAIVGMQGGDAQVQHVFGQLQVLNTPLAGFWLQDWVGKRKTAIGSQLWWNWHLNEKHYPRWQALRQTLQAQNQHLLGYINPFLVDVPAEFGSHDYQEARRKNFFVKDHQGQVYAVKNTDFSAGLLDLTNPAARQWIKNIIRRELIEKAGFKAWMADYAEALPVDAVLFAGDARTVHNQYPALWAQVNAEAIAESGCKDCIFFMRAGYTRSQAIAPLFWTGDQMVTWDAQDGMASALQGLISGGLSGISLNHSDAGGYTSVALPLFGGVTRSQELLLRWLETNVFTPLLRTHEGNQPERNAQIYDSAENLHFFKHCAQIYADLFDYRKGLIEEAHTRGWPVVRHMVLHYPADLTAQRLNDQFLLGEELLVAPVLTAGQRQRQVYLPAGNWRHLWTQTAYHSPQNRWVTVAAPLGYPPVFYRETPENQRRFSRFNKIYPFVNGFS